MKDSRVAVVAESSNDDGVHSVSSAESLLSLRRLGESLADGMVEGKNQEAWDFNADLGEHCSL